MGRLNLSPDNEKARDEIKFTFGNWRALLLRREVERNFNSALFQQRFVVPLIKVDEVDNCLITLDCLILRSANKVPFPIKRHQANPFELVSAVSIRGIEDIYKYQTASSFPLQRFNKFTSNIISYDFVNQYLYILGNKKIKQVAITDTFESPEEINSCASGDTCYSDDKPYPLSKDLIQQIIEGILRGEIAIKPKDVEVKTDNKEE